MGKKSWLLAALALAFPAAELTRAGQPAGASFQLSIAADAWQKFGFRYPATYVFALPEVSGKVEVKRRDAPGGAWTTLGAKTEKDLFNGVECVRFDPQQRKAYVSVAFNAAATVDLEFQGPGRVDFVEVAQYYDHRKAACSLSLDNWGRQAGSRPGAPWKGAADDQSDKYQAALSICREFRIPVSIAINTGMFGGDALWQNMQAELDRQDYSWEPAVHARTHPCSAKAYSVNGYRAEILDCRDELLRRLRNIPYGQHIFEHILTCGYQDESILQTDRGEFVFVRGWNSRDNPASVGFSPWNQRYGFYGIGGLSYKAYDAVFQRRKPAGRYHAADVQTLNAAFDQVFQSGGIFYAMWHPDRYANSVIHDPRPGVDGVQGSSLMQHLGHIANRKDVWYVANGWLYCYRYVAEHVRVDRRPSSD